MKVSLGGDWMRSCCQSSARTSLILRPIRLVSGMSSGWSVEDESVGSWGSCEEEMSALPSVCGDP